MYYQIIAKVNYHLTKLHTQFWKKMFWGHIGEKTVIYSPMKIVNPMNISIGDGVIIEANSTLYCVGNYQGINHQGNISIGNDVYINYGFNATTANRITIEDGVLCAFNVSIFDFDHGYEDVFSNINRAELTVKGPIVIGEKSWIGMNVAILGSVNIGKHCIIGANSVVTKDIPDYCVVAGSPARIIKRYNKLTKIWEKV
jgi:acetyltransferase-like isoleucine patch superfamily enzyme